VLMQKQRRIKKVIFIPLGIICVALGIIGIVLPVLPTTPFLLLAAFLFYRSSNKLHDRLLNSKILGEYISNYMKYRAIHRKLKILAITTLWISLSISIVLVNIIFVRIFLITIGIAVTVHILHIKTLEKVKTPN